MGRSHRHIRCASWLGLEIHTYVVRVAVWIDTAASHTRYDE